MPLFIETTKDILVQATRPVSGKKQRAWLRSVPVTETPGRLCRGALANIRAYDQDIVLRYDPKFYQITVWRRPSIGRWHPLLQFINPFGRTLDGRLFHVILNGDRENQWKKMGVRSHSEYWDALLDAQAKADQDRQAEILRRTDPAKVLHAMRRKSREIDGKARGLFAQVHSGTPISNPGNLGLLPNGTVTSLPSAHRIPVVGR